MYSFHPFGGIETHPYGGSIGGPLKNFLNKGRTIVAEKLSPAEKAKPAKKAAATSPKIGTGASPKAFKAMALNMANIDSTLANFQRLQAATSQLMREPVYEEQPYMAMGGEAEGGFFETYKNYIIIGGAIAVVGAFALYMRNR